MVLLIIRLPQASILGPLCRQIYTDLIGYNIVSASNIDDKHLSSSIYCDLPSYYNYEFNDAHFKGTIQYP